MKRFAFRTQRQSKLLKLSPLTLPLNLLERTLVEILYELVTRLMGLKSLTLIERSFLGIRVTYVELRLFPC